MKTILVPTILAATFVAARALAGDVAYQLETKPLRSIEQPTLAQPLTVAFEERIWALPGLEDAAGGDYRNWSTSIDRVSRNSIVFKAPDPIWTDEQLWPRTQAMWGRGEYYRNSPRFHLEPADGYFISSIGLQR